MKDSFEASLTVLALVISISIVVDLVKNPFQQVRDSWQVTRERNDYKIERDNLQLQLDRLRKNLGERKIGGKCVMLQLGQKP